MKLKTGSIIESIEKLISFSSTLKGSSIEEDAFLRQKMQLSL